jgi:ADP-ribose pyrophosphatase YjhB (NUDIX family)
MIKERIGFAWRALPYWLRRRIIRTTQPKFTVSSAAIITNDKGEVLLLNHVLRPDSGWGLPGGFLGAREQPDEAIRREIREETGIELDGLRMFRVRTTALHVEVMFVATGVGEPVVNSREILELGWFDTDSMPEKLPRAQKRLIREALTGRRKAEG